MVRVLQGLVVGVATVTLCVGLVVACVAIAVDAPRATRTAPARFVAPPAVESATDDVTALALTNRR